MASVNSYNAKINNLSAKIEQLAAEHRARAEIAKPTPQEISWQRGYERGVNTPSQLRAKALAKAHAAAKAHESEGKIAKAAIFRGEIAGIEDAR
jgi:hypothetical protein